MEFSHLLRGPTNAFSSRSTVETDSPLHPIFVEKNECSFALQKCSAHHAQLFGPLPGCISRIIFCPPLFFWISVRLRWRVGVAMMFRSALENPRDGPNCSRMLMNRSATFVYFSSRCDLGDILPLFFRVDRLTFAGPTVGSSSSTS